MEGLDLGVKLGTPLPPRRAASPMMGRSPMLAPKTPMLGAKTPGGGKTPFGGRKAMLAPKSPMMMSKSPRQGKNKDFLNQYDRYDFKSSCGLQEFWTIIGLFLLLLFVRLNEYILYYSKANFLALPTGDSDSSDDDDISTSTGIRRSKSAGLKTSPRTKGTQTKIKL